jgi:uracil-DNA glycosylase family 4
VLLKPLACSGCVLADSGKGYAPADGPDTSPLLLVGEALGATEAAVGKPFVGDAGSMLARLFKMLGWEREHLRIDNSIRCRPPNDWLEGAPWQYAALDACAPYLNDSLASPYLKVVVPMGTTAIKRVMRVSGKKIGPNNFHGTVTRDPLDRFYIVPTFHPSYLQRGAHNLIGTVLWDLQQAFKAITDNPPPDPASIVCDPPLEWFKAWVDLVIAARQQDPSAYPISSDIETPDKAGGQDEGEISSDDRSFTILRWNVSCHQDEGITVPFQGPYIDQLIRLHQSPGPIWGWNFTGYDFERAVVAGVLKAEDFHKVLDLMWVAHQLQSDVPRGLGFWAPFYSSFGPWKHLADSEPARYAAIDGFQTHRVGFGLLRDHQKLGTWPTVARHVHQLHHLVLKPAQMVGVKVDRERLTLFKSTLSDKATTLLNTLQESYPDGLRNLTPKQGLVSRPKENVLHVKASAFTRKGKKRKGKDVTDLKLDLYRQAVVVERELVREVRCCESCGGVGVHTKHRCKDRSLVPATVLRLETVTRYFWSEPFNPDSWQQVLNYIKFKKHQPGKAKKTKKDSTDRETLDRLSRTGDPLYLTLLDYRAVIKVKGTYVEGTERRMDDEGRIHPEPTFKPSTSRLSYVNPNITNVITRVREGRENLAAGFRRCLVASPGCRLLEVDFGGSEQVDVGWYSRDPNHIRLARLGIHAGLASHVLKRPYDPSWSPEVLGAYFKEIKQAKDEKTQAVYERSKRFVHGFSYGLTIPGMVLQFPETFPNHKVAEEYADIFRSMAPKIPAWQRQVRERAFKQHYLGGPGDHPFGYKHWFWSVFTYKKITAGQYWAIVQKMKRKGIEEGDSPVAVINGQYFRINLGEDAKRCVAFYPQSTTAGKLKEAMLRLFDPEQPAFIGDVYFGKTPLRAPIHDSLLLEIPTKVFDLVASIVVQEMQRPLTMMPCPEEWNLGPYLSTGVSVKVGTDGGDWASLSTIAVTELGVGSDVLTTAAVGDEEEVADLGREVA